MPDAKQPSATIKRPRVLFIFLASFVTLIYGFYAAANIDLLWMNRHDTELLTATRQLPQADFGLFWCAGNGLAEQAEHRFGVEFPEAFRNICQTDILAANAPVFLAWPYPPTMGLLVTPFSFLPIKFGFWVWRAFCILAAAWVLRLAGLGWRVILLGLASPAAWHDLIGGQDGTLSGGVLVAILLMASRRPVTAGGLAGLLTLKPHLGLPILVAVLRSRAWRLALVAVAIAIGLVGLSLLFWGTEGWVWFFGIAQHDEWLTTNMPFKERFPAAGITIYHMARSLGGSNAWAWRLQCVGAAMALTVMWKLWRPGLLAEKPRMICTVCLSILVLPHGFLYDLVGFSVAMALLMIEFEGWVCFAAALLWLWGGYTGTFAKSTGLLLFPLCAVAGALLAWCVRDAPAWRQKNHPSRLDQPTFPDVSGYRPAQ
ncbi:MAG TPA: glycosyltransferase family 87 protein [Acidocella sp.]|nr:glycosyltransferase family 87 protein [Acidocella sp.]